MRWISTAATASVSCQHDMLSTGGELGLILLGLRLMFRPVLRAGLRVADGLGQHLTQLSLRLRWLPRDRCLPVSHDLYLGMPEGELNPTRSKSAVASGQEGDSFRHSFAPGPGSRLAHLSSATWPAKLARLSFGDTMTIVKLRATTILTALGDAQSELVGKAVILTDGKAGMVENAWLDELHGLRISIRGHDGKWPISTIKLEQSSQTLGESGSGLSRLDWIAAMRELSSQHRRVGDKSVVPVTFPSWLFLFRVQYWTHILAPIPAARSIPPS